MNNKKGSYNAFLEYELLNNVSVEMDIDLVNDALLVDQNQNSVEIDVPNAANDSQSKNELKSELFNFLLLTLTSKNNDITRKLKNQ